MVSKRLFIISFALSSKNFQIEKKKRKKERERERGKEKKGRVGVNQAGDLRNYSVSPTN